MINIPLQCHVARGDGVGVLLLGGAEDGVLAPGDAGRSGLTSSSCMAAFSGFI